ncbi:universal stress protein [Streptomyces sp. VRA16 Mangrove soil]|uniref:universal stress protein n=1 Tax=Streptomyces sp. VRA16 Mangrove soil TaxID=2817434 RepID=UPI001A9F1D77|nr:universal stress protein [Streptomyces sp. VRA16 Mangrove soil]MBO1332290.1 universal stress protein [Streptomyces sp. VRA16 Mangrove soil]
MSRTITVGLDGSPESRAAAEWAAHEAELRDQPLHLVHVRQPVPEPLAQAPLVGPEAYAHWTGRILGEGAQRLAAHHPRTPVTTEQRTGVPAQELTAAAHDAGLLVLGSRGLGRVAGYAVGSVSLSVIAHTRVPVVLVRTAQQPVPADAQHPVGGAGAPHLPVILGLDPERADDRLLDFAFDEAAHRDTALRVVHCWDLSPYYVYGLPADPALRRKLGAQQAAGLATALEPWRRKYPHVPVIEDSRYGRPVHHLVDIAREGSLLVVGRRVHRRPFGTHIGSVVHAVLHHSTVPVAVVAHGAQPAG